MKCFKCKQGEIKGPSPIPFVVGVVLWIGGVAVNQSSAKLPMFLTAFSGLASGVGLILTVVALVSLLRGKKRCSSCGHTPGG